MLTYTNLPTKDGGHTSVTFYRKKGLPDGAVVGILNPQDWAALRDDVREDLREKMAGEGLVVDEGGMPDAEG